MWCFIMYSLKNRGSCLSSITICHGKTIAKKIRKPIMKYTGLNNSLNFFAAMYTKNIVPKGSTNPGIPFVIFDLISLYGHTGKIFLKKFSVCGVFFLWNADNAAFTNVPEGIGTDFGDSGGKSDIF